MEVIQFRVASPGCVRFLLGEVQIARLENP
jgi:hypothetical protein